MNQKFKCPNCHVAFYELTDSFEYDATAHGGMLKLVEPYNGFGWDTYADGVHGAASVPASSMLCVGCGGTLCPTGRFSETKPKLKQTPQKEKSTQKPNSRVCPICGEDFHNMGKYLSHMRHHKKVAHENT